MTFKVLPGFPNILDTQTKTFSLYSKNKNNWIHIVYLIKIEKDEGIVRIKTAHSSNPDSWRKGVQIKNAQVIAGIQKVGNKVILCLHEKFKELLPSSRKRILIENQIENGSKCEKINFGDYEFYNENKYSKYLDHAYEIYGKMCYNSLKKNGLLK